MKLIDDIIDLLSSQNASLTDALLKTKILLHKIGHKELVEWVNNELNGYSHNIDLPEYRVLPANVLANIANLSYEALSHPIPLGHLNKEEREFFLNAHFFQSLAVLEKLVEDQDSSLHIPIAMELNGLLGKSLANDYKIQRAWRAIGTADISQIFVQVRSRLLDFILELKDRLGDDITEKEIKQRTESIDTQSLFNNAIFGDNTTILVGNHNTQETNNITVRGNFNSIAEYLKQHKVDESSIADLQKAINNDQNSTEVKERKIGSSVKEWMKQMLSKAVEATWEIELNVAGNLLTSAIQRYYGWS